MNDGKRLPRIEAIATTFNRKEITLQGFSKLLSQKGIETEFKLHATVVDDNSSDGTKEALESDFHGLINCISGSGQLFWSRGMSLAEKAAMTEKIDYILWFNDDVILDQDAVLRLLDCSANNPNSIVIGAMIDADGNTSYSGLVKPGIRPGNLRLVQPTEFPQKVDTFHGNLVLVPFQVATDLGSIDSGYEHAYGDIDYGLRAQLKGYTCVLAPKSFGQCEPNIQDLAWRNSSFSRQTRIKYLFSKKGYPIRSHIRYNRRHGGSLWPLFITSSYAKNLASILFTPRKQELESK